MRKCGIGRALMAKIHKIAEKEKAAIIATNPESHHAAHALYRKLGELDRPHFGSRVIHFDSFGVQTLDRPVSLQQAYKL